MKGKKKGRREWRANVITIIKKKDSETCYLPLIAMCGVCVVHVLSDGVVKCWNSKVRVQCASAGSSALEIFTIAHLVDRDGDPVACDSRLWHGRDVFETLGGDYSRAPDARSIGLTPCFPAPHGHQDAHSTNVSPCSLSYLRRSGAVVVLNRRNVLGSQVLGAL